MERNRGRGPAKRLTEIAGACFVLLFLVVWFGSFFGFIYNAGGADAAYAAVRWIAGLGPQ